MNPDVKAQWLAALRSGEYKQGYKYLRGGDQFCCLGVLCDIYSKTGQGHWNGDYFMTAQDSDVTALPSDVVEWAGVEDFNPDVKGLPIAVYNDGDEVKGIHPHTFAELADLIEEYL